MSKVEQGAPHHRDTKEIVKVPAATTTTHYGTCDAMGHPNARTTYCTCFGEVQNCPDCGGEWTTHDSKWHPAPTISAPRSLDWMNGNDLSADHADQRPKDYATLCESLLAFKSLIKSAPQAESVPLSVKVEAAVEQVIDEAQQAESVAFMEELANPNNTPSLDIDSDFVKHVPAGKDAAWEELAAQAIIDAASDRQDARFCRLLDSWKPDFAKIIAKHAASETAALRAERDKLKDSDGEI